MNAPLHFNLLKESEMLSSSPVRIRVMMPLMALLVNLGLVVWLLLLGLRREMLGVPDYSNLVELPQEVSLRQAN